MKEVFAESLDAPPARAFAESALLPLRQLNTYALDTFSHCARHPSWAGSAWAFALGEHFSQVSLETRTELARSPVSLLEFGTSSSAMLDAKATDPKRPSPPPFLPFDKAMELNQMLLTLTWTFSRHDSAAAVIVFGLTAVEVHKVRSLDVRDIPRIAEQLAGVLRPRWLERPRIWHALLRYSDGTRSYRVAPAYLRILQRQLADCRLQHAQRG